LLEERKKYGHDAGVLIEGSNGRRSGGDFFSQTRGLELRKMRWSARK
jgi:hypothetical protein